MENEMLQSALEYAELGFSVVPIVRGMKQPPKGVTWVNRRFNSADECSDEKWKWEHPNVEWGKADEKQLRQWWKKYLTANIGILTGAISGIDSIDLDGPHALETLETQANIRLPESVDFITGREDSGRQIVYRYHGGGLKNTARFCSNGNGSQCDIRTDGGLIVVPPSIHRSGKRYSWSTDPRIEDPAPFPADLVSFIRKRQGSDSTGTSEYNKTDYDEYFANGIPDGDKHHGLFKFACKKISQGLSYAEVLCLTTETARHCTPLPKDGPEHAAKVRVDEAWAKYGTDENNNKQDDSTDTDNISIVTLGEIHRMRKEFPEPLIEGLLERGDNLLISGQGGLGKSLVTLSVAISVAAGKKAFHQFRVDKPHHVLLLQSENSIKATRNRLEALMFAHKNRVDFPEYKVALDVSYSKNGDIGLKTILGKKILGAASDHSPDKRPGIRTRKGRPWTQTGTI